MRVVDALAEWMEGAGFHQYFGYAGGAIWPILDGLIDHDQLHGVQAKHESHAVHQADVYYRMTGQLAPVIVTKGPGLLNTVGAVASARHDSVPVLIIAGGTATHFLGKAGMQEMYYQGHEDAVSVMRPITKGSWMVVRPDTVIDTLNHAVRVAMSGRPGPVFVQIPTDIQTAEVEGEVPLPQSRAVRGGARADREDVARVATLLREAQKPVLLAGGGVARANGGAQRLREVVEALQVPTVTTLTAKGILPEDHDLSLGPVGRSGTLQAARTTREADLVVAVGARFSDNHAGNWRKGAIYDVPRTKIVQVDLSIDEIGRNYPVELGLQCDAGAFLADLLEHVSEPLQRSAWHQTIAGFRREWEDELRPVIESTHYPIHPGKLSYEVGEALPENGHVFIDVGDVIQYAEPYMRIRRPGHWHINSGMAEMGWASQGAIACRLADPGALPIVLTGDGAFLMGPQVLATAVQYNLPAVWVVLNNYELGIEKKGAGKAFGRHHPWMFFRGPDEAPYNPDFAAMARSYGAEGARVEKAGDFAPALQEAIARGRPYVLDVEIDPDVATYFTKGLDRAYPDTWKLSYGAQGQLEIK